MSTGAGPVGNAPNEWEKLDEKILAGGIVGGALLALFMVCLTVCCVKRRKDGKRCHIYTQNFLIELSYHVHYFYIPSELYVLRHHKFYFQFYSSGASVTSSHRGLHLQYSGFPLDSDMLVCTEPIHTCDI